VVPVEDRHVLQDVDTPEDYQALLGAAPAEPG
jgi:CTP:molybdopterin cytidylyltransferase MocA